jgi:hypothetical protein
MSTNKYPTNGKSNIYSIYFSGMLLYIYIILIKLTPIINTATENIKILLFYEKSIFLLVPLQNISIQNTNAIIFNGI